MRWDVVAVDTAGGRAVLRKEERWYLVTKNREWQPVDVDSRRAQFLAASMTRVRRSCGGLEDAIHEVRRLCAGDPPGSLSPAAWEEGFPDVIRRFGRSLDRFFEARGLSTGETFRLSLEVFRRLFERGPVAESEVSWLLYRLAVEIRPAAHGIPSGTPRAGERAAGPRVLEGVRLGRAVRALDPRTLRCLYFWTVLKSGRRATARLARLSEDEVRARLVEVAARLGRPVEQLGDPDVVEACIEAVKGRRR